MRNESIQTSSLKTIMLPILVVAVAVVLVGYGATVLPPAVDWEGAFRPATLAIAHLENPYHGGFGFYNPPWTLLFLIPFAIDVEIGRAALLILSLGIYGLVAVKMRAPLLALIAFLISPPIMHTMLHGNVEWLALAGLLLPPRWGLFFVMIKPQIGGMVAVYWIVEAWRQGGWQRTVWLLWPVGTAFLASVALFGLWPINAMATSDQWWNASFWPYSIPFGLAALGWAISKRDIRGALIASPCLSPHVLLHAWSGALLATTRNQWLTVLIVTLLWIVAFRNL